MLARSQGLVEAPEMRRASIIRADNHDGVFPQSSPGVGDHPVDVLVQADHHAAELSPPEMRDVRAPVQLYRLYSTRVQTVQGCESTCPATPAPAAAVSAPRCS